MPENCANPKLAEWLKEWMDQAKEQNNKGYFTYKKAYESIKACPLRFSHPSEAQQLNGLGPKLCDRLTKKMRQFCEENGLDMPSKKGHRKRPREALLSEPVEPEQASPVRRPRKTQPYVPKLRSGAYALMLALTTLDQDSNQAIPKKELIELAQPHCDSSFFAPSDPTKFYTAWKSMETLERKELVCTKGHPTKKYYLSDEGWEVATRMKATLAGRGVPSPSPRKKRKTEARETRILPSLSPEPMNRRTAPAIPPTLDRPREAITQSSCSTIVDLLSSPEPDWPASEPELNSFNFGNKHLHMRPPSAGPSSKESIVLPAGSFEVKMILDMREIRTTTDRDYISGELKKLGVVPIIRSLPLGDVLWIADVHPLYAEALKAANVGDDEGNLEIVLEHILERKRLDDLIGSIIDGRFHEQKFRLHKSGIKHVTYLVEQYSLSAERSEKYGESLESAIAGMQVVDNFFVKQTAKLDDTIRYLARMTKTLKELYESKNIHVIPSQSFEGGAVATTLERLRKSDPGRIYGMTFSVFGAMCDKSESMTLRDVYLKMLMCTRGVTGEKAIEIQKIWPTPRALAEALESRNKGPEKENMISDRLGNAIPRKKVAKALSAKIAEIWG
ncbi:uncharacterized protein Z518_06628 [Rhinocladiella mackenziei CBS 650.93]|uniref:Crossover junction endonuclease MUS81 n=1 Tax=Rhinocladiella mackenziei CBS 650.93 TaxID=1442369 RepID=A0A0D2GY07_9EURO|nr:uncharacterized protein Z518_06628 [Rhinocladiella mackenziei CBS 650.93]KIX03078.1 hypothetical protein Z518_06628 [Rhinocladiella mackenziei CBS 650.93]